MISIEDSDIERELKKAKAEADRAEERYDQLYMELARMDEAIAATHAEIQGSSKAKKKKRKSGHHARWASSDLKEKLADLRVRRKRLAERVRKNRSKLRAKRQAVRDILRQQKSWSAASKRYQSAWHRSYKRKKKGTVITAGQLRAAQALLGVKQSEFAAMLEMPPATLRRYDRNGKVTGGTETVRDMRRKLTALGVVLIEPGLHMSEGGPGVRLRRMREPALLAEKPAGMSQSARAGRKKSRKKRIA